MAIGCRIVICGVRSQYDIDDPAEQYGVKNLPQLVFRQGRMRGFVVPHFADKQAAYDERLVRLWRDGKLTLRSHVVDGFESCADAVTINLEGRNRGEVMVRVAGA